MWICGVGVGTLDAPSFGSQFGVFPASPKSLVEGSAVTIAVCAP